MSRKKEDIDITVEAPEETGGEEQVAKSKARRFWDYVNDYKRKTVALALPSVAFDIVYSGFLMLMSMFRHSLWLFIMSVYHFLLCMIRINILYRAGRGAVFKSKRFSERKNYHKFSRNLILLDLVFAYAVFLIASRNVVHDFKGLLVYFYGVYVIYKLILSIINLFRAHKSNSLTVVALRKLGIVDTMVSILALEWAFSHRNAGGLTTFALQIEKYIGIAAVIIIFLMGFAGFITCAKLRRQEKKQKKEGTE